MKISAVLIAQNEAHRIGTAIRSASFCDEVLVVDGGSSDDTESVARRLGARVVARTFDGYSEQKNFALGAAAHDVVLSLDSDEEVTSTLRQDIEDVTRLPDLPRPAYRVLRVTHYLGVEIRATDWHPDWQVRLFDRRRGQFSKTLVHESFRLSDNPSDPPGSLAGELIHRPYRDVEEHRRRIDRYTTLWAEQAARDGKTATFAAANAAAAFAFLRNYVFKGGLFLGSVGFAVSRLNASYVYWKYAKLAARSSSVGRS
jgi:glycosyltransferase involved in cell wall biosynthesis